MEREKKLLKLKEKEARATQVIKELRLSLLIRWDCVEYKYVDKLDVFRVSGYDFGAGVERKDMNADMLAIPINL